MATTHTRLTFVVTKEMEPLLANAKRVRFYDRSRSEMIRELLMAGLKSLDEKDQEDCKARKACTQNGNSYWENKNELGDLQK